MTDEKQKRQYPKIPDEAIVKPEDERPVKTTVRPEEEMSKDERDYEKMKTVGHDMDGDGDLD